MSDARRTLHGAASRWFSRDAIRRVDGECVATYTLPGAALMENAAAGLLNIALEMLANRPARVLLLCGPGNNGGDGFALARRLHNAGAATDTLLFRAPAAYQGDAKVNLRVLEAMGLPRQTIEGDDPGPAVDEAMARGPGLVVDALLGTGLTAPPRGAVGEAIAWLAARDDAPVLAVDIPSGLNCDTGEPFEAQRCVRATVTATMAGLKIGFRNPASRAWTGRVEVVDIGAPRDLLDRLATVRARGGDQG